MEKSKVNLVKKMNLRETVFRYNFNDTISYEEGKKFFIKIW